MPHFTNTPLISPFITRLALIACTILPATAMAEKFAKIDQAYAASDANFIVNYAKY